LNNIKLLVTRPVSWISTSITVYHASSAVNRTVPIIPSAVRYEVGLIYLSFTLRIISFIIYCLFDCL